MTSPTENLSSKKKPSSFAKKIFDFLSSFGLATVLLFILLLQTWLATLEQIDYGLYATLRKYFEPQAIIILSKLRLPDYVGGQELTIPLPGGYWVLSLLFINMLLGGIIRARKGWKKIGTLISHFGILFMIGSAAVTQKMEVRGTMDFFEGETSNVAQDYFESVIEISERTNGIPDKVHVIRGKHLQDLSDDFIRTVKIPELPFDVNITRYGKNTRVLSVTEMAPPNGEPVIDGYFIFNRPDEKEAETNIAGCYAKVLPRDGESRQPLILSSGAFQPQTVKINDRVFIIEMKKLLWPMPFSLRLDKAIAEYYPGTQKPAKFESKVTRIENNTEASVEIKMNEPMRYEGLTFYQRMMGGEQVQGGAKSKPYSQLEVVSNPADQWPKYALYVVTLGLLVHFVLKFSLFIHRLTRKKQLL
jgi:ResB-like family